MLYVRRTWLRRAVAASVALLSTGLTAVAAAQSRDQWQQPERVAADLALKPGAVVADIGCGDGYFTFRLAEGVGAKGKVYAVDIDAGAVETVKRRARSSSAANIEGIVSDPSNTKLPAGALDAAFFCNVFHEASPEARLPLMRDTARALKPGGCLYLIDWRKSREVTGDPYEKLIPLDDLVKLGRDAGLTLDAEYHYLRLQVFLRFRKPNAAR